MFRKLNINAINTLKDFKSTCIQNAILTKLKVTNFFNNLKISEFSPTTASHYRQLYFSLCLFIRLLKQDKFKTYFHAIYRRSRARVFVLKYVCRWPCKLKGSLHCRGTVNSFEHFRGGAKSIRCYGNNDKSTSELNSMYIDGRPIEDGILDEPRELLRVEFGVNSLLARSTIDQQLSPVSSAANTSTRFRL